MSAPPTDKEIARTWAERLVVALDLVSVGSVLKLHCVQEHILSALVQAREQDKKALEDISEILDWCAIVLHRRLSRYKRGGGMDASDARQSVSLPPLWQRRTKT